MSDSGHPSFLELDRLALGASRDGVAGHVAACDACRARVAPASSALDVPAWARELGPRRRPWLSWPALSGLGFAVAALAGVALVWSRSGLHGASSPDGYVGTKGSPELRLFVKRGARVDVWSPAHPVAAGDLLRLEVQPSGFTHVSVFEATPTTTPSYDRLYDAAVEPGHPTALPVSWKVDDRAEPETLVVVLGAEPVAPADLARVLDESPGRHWSRRLVLTRASGADGSAP